MQGGSIEKEGKGFPKHQRDRDNFEAPLTNANARLAEGAQWYTRKTKTSQGKGAQSHDRGIWKDLSEGRKGKGKMGSESLLKGADIFGYVSAQPRKDFPGK